eukprot:m.629931 g.629931  ORF g.629931 m.629931 type:complete len:826 (-) comp22563_c0_seq2:300-2777(-)
MKLNAIMSTGKQFLVALLIMSVLLVILNHQKIDSVHESKQKLRHLDTSTSDAILSSIHRVQKTLDTYHKHEKITTNERLEEHRFASDISRNISELTSLLRTLRSSIKESFAKRDLVEVVPKQDKIASQLERIEKRLNESIHAREHQQPVLLERLIDSRATAAAPATFGDAQWENETPRIIFGIHTSGFHRYEQKLGAQFQTWARRIPKDRILVIGPQCEPSINKCGKKDHPQSPGSMPEELLWTPSHCKEADKWCKVLTYLRAARARLDQWQFDWLVGLNEDQYVYEPALRKALLTKNASIAQVLAHHGCGRHWEYDARSKNNTIPKPDSFFNSRGACDQVYRLGGVCGGTGIAWSRGALLRLFEHGDPDQTSFNRLAQVDLTASCWIRNAHIAIEWNPWKGESLTDGETPVSASRDRAIFHVINEDGTVVAERMRRLDALYYPADTAAHDETVPTSGATSRQTIDHTVHVASKTASAVRGSSNPVVLSAAAQTHARGRRERRKYSALYDAYASDRYELNPPEPVSTAYKQFAFPIHELSPTFDNYSVSREFLDHLQTLDAIPKLIHISWVSKDLLKSRNELVLNGVLQEVKLNPDWKARIWTDDEVEDYLQTKLSARAYDLMKSTKIIEKLDLWRLLVIYYEGGFYMDVDRHYNVPLSHLIKSRTKMLMPVMYLINFSQSLMCSARYNVLFKFAIHVLLYLREFTPSGPVMKYGPEAYKFANCKAIFGFDNGNVMNGGAYPPADKITDARCDCSESELQTMLDRATHEPVGEWITAQKEVWYYTIIFNKSMPGWHLISNNGTGGTEASQLREEFNLTHWTKTKP